VPDVRHRDPSKYSLGMRGRTYLLGVVTLILVVGIGILIRFEEPRPWLAVGAFYAIFFFGLGIVIGWPVLLVATFAIGAWMEWSDKRGLPTLGLHHASLIWLVPLLALLVGAVAYNVRIVTCSMQDQSACPQVGYDDIQFLQAEGIADPYYMDFQEVRTSGAWWTRADWAVEYRTWGDGTWVVACREITDDSIRCSVLDSYDEYPAPP
jgi:hypothetical protein